MEHKKLYTTPYGDLRGLPPMFIYVYEGEILRDDSIQFAEKAKDADVDVTLTFGTGMFHCSPLCAPFFPEETLAIDKIYTFIETYLKMKLEVQYHEIECIL